jgi:uncharacterized membrane protein YkvA (DUF1232 family)
MNDYQKKYSEKGFWKTFEKLKDQALKNPKIKKLIIDALTLFYALKKSKKITLKQKASILGALGYLILPFDIVPDMLPVVGWLDDAGIVLAAYQNIKGDIEPSIRKYANEFFKEKFGL